MTSKGFSIGEAIAYGWRTMKSNFFLLCGFLLLAFLTPLVPNFVILLVMGPQEKLMESGDSFFIGVSVVAILLQIILMVLVQLGVVNVSLKFAAGERAKIRDLYSCGALLIKYVTAGILYGLITMVGFILLVVPGVIWGLRYSMFAYLIVEKRLGPIQALKASAVVTYGAKWDLFGLYLLSMLIAFLGALCLLIGLFAALPTLWIAHAFVYRKLCAQMEGTITQAAG